MLSPLKIVAAPDHQELFLERYDRILTWALQLTGNDRGLAEDLAQNAFIQFTLARTDLQSIQNLDGYLYGMLRNLHLSEVRRTTRGRLERLSVVEYDSAEAGLHAADPRDLVHAQDDLRKVCAYACSRKETSPAASVLILRFFHGYYPSEIALVMRSSGQVVKKRLRLARSEARLCLANPGALALIGEKPVAIKRGEISPRNGADFVVELRGYIFASRQGACPGEASLREMYENEENESIDHELLAHLVSCRSCLDSVNTILELPVLAERHPGDLLGNEPRSGKGPPAGGPRGGAGASRATRATRDAFEHDPKELCVSVNGYVQGEQKVSSELSELVLNVNLYEDIRFVEVFSEQNVRLLFLNVEKTPPDGPGEHSLKVALSEGRTLEATLRFTSPWPKLQVIYFDPTHDAIPAAAGEPADALSVLGLSSSPGQLVNSSAWPERGLRAWVASLGSSLLRAEFWLRPVNLTATLVILIAAGLLISRLSAPKVTASSLLRRSAAVEAALSSRTDIVLHRTINFEERKLPDGSDARVNSSAGVLVVRRRIEIWHSAAKGVTTHRLYDENNNLLAEEWIAINGVHTMYEKGSSAHSEQPMGRDAINFDNAWRVEPAAADYLSLISEPDRAAVQQNSAAYTVRYEGRDPSAPHRLVEASLVLSRGDLHPTEERLVLKQAGESREFRYTESRFERRPVAAVSPSVFEPDPELLASGSIGSRIEKANAAPGAAMVDPSVNPPQPVASADLELEVMRLLDGVGANLGDQINVTRVPDGELKVQGIVDTDNRKRELLQALDPVQGNRAVRIEIKTPAEAMQGAQDVNARGTIRVQTVDPESGRLPVYDELVRYLSGRSRKNASAAGGTESTRVADDQAVLRFAAEILNHSHQAMRHAGALKRLVTQFSPEELQSLTPADHANWRSLIGGHARAYAVEMAIVDREMGPVFPEAATAGPPVPPSRISDDATLIKYVMRLFDLGLTLDQSIRAALTVSSHPPQAQNVKDREFWIGINESRSLAEGISAIASP